MLGWPSDVSLLVTGTWAQVIAGRPAEAPAVPCLHLEELVVAAAGACFRVSPAGRAGRLLKRRHSNRTRRCGKGMTVSTMRSSITARGHGPRWCVAARLCRTGRGCIAGVLAAIVAAAGRPGTGAVAAPGIATPWRRGGPRDRPVDAWRAVVPGPGCRHWRAGRARPGAAGRARATEQGALGWRTHAPGRSSGLAAGAFSGRLRRAGFDVPAAGR